MKGKWWIVGILAFFEVVICAAIVFALWVGRPAVEGVRFFYRADTHIEDTIEKAFAVAGPATLDLQADFSNVTVTGGTGDTVQVVAKLDLWGADEQDARSQVDVQMSQQGNRIVIREVRPERVYAFAFFTGNSQVNYEIRVPAETSLQLATSSGNLGVSGTAGAAELRTDFGDIRVENVAGPVSTRTSSGKITLIGLSDAGNLEVNTDFGDLILQDVTADSLTARTNSGKIRVEEGTVDGALDLETDFGSITVTDVEAASYRLVSSSGDLTLDGCRGSLDLQTDFGSIEVKRARDAQLTLKTQSGEINFSGSLSERGEHRVETDFGGIHLVLPADAAFDLDAQTDFGSIETDFSVTVSEFGEKRIVGKVNGGGPSLQISTSSGNITLESSSGEND